MSGSNHSRHQEGSGVFGNLFHEIAVLCRYVRLRISERLRSPLWRFIGGQRPLEFYEEEIPELLETAAPEKMQDPETAPEVQPKQFHPSPSQKLLDRFDEKFNAREKRKREAVQNAASRHAKDDRQMTFEFGGDLEIPEPEEPEEPAYLGNGEYTLPPFSLFVIKDEENDAAEEEIRSTTVKIQDCLDNFNFDAEVIGAIHGPAVTLYKIMVGKGIRADSIMSYKDDVTMALAAPSLRVLVPVGGTDYAGIEVPNQNPSTVLCGNILNGRAWHQFKGLLPLVLGRDINGNDVVMDLAKAPHLLVAGATGTGKSVCLNTFIVSLISKYSPEDLRLMLVDPKRVEMQMYNNLPHLLVPVINEVEVVLIALRWLVYEMERRLSVIAKVGVRNIADFNSRPPMTEEILDDEFKPIPQKLPYIVLVIDELADIMISAKKEVEQCLARLAAKSRAIGIHIIVATQRPSVDVLTGTIKSNFPIRIAFRSSTQIDSRTILDEMGAESLLGRGDMLFKSSSTMGCRRIQGAMVTDGEIQAVCAFCAAQGMPPKDYESIKNTASVDKSSGDAGDGEDESVGDESDDLFMKAVECIVTTRKGSISYLQRVFKIGYNRAADLMDRMEKMGLVGENVGGKREIIPDDMDEARQIIRNYNGSENS